MATKNPKLKSKVRKRSNILQAPENLPTRAESAKNGTGNPDGMLTEMQRLFVVGIAEHGMSQSAAARAAGYAEKTAGVTGMELMKMPKVQSAIAERKAEYAAASGVTKKMVIDGFIEAINMGRLLEDPMSMISGWREVGKMCGFYEASKSEIKISVNGQVMLSKLESMSDAELLKLTEGGDQNTIEMEK